MARLKPKPLMPVYKVASIKAPRFKLRLPPLPKFRVSNLKLPSPPRRIKF